MIDIDAIRRDNPLPDVAGKIVTLRPAGKEWVRAARSIPIDPPASPSLTAAGAFNALAAGLAVTCWTLCSVPMG